MSISRRALMRGFRFMRGKSYCMSTSSSHASRVIAAGTRNPMAQACLLMSTSSRGSMSSLRRVRCRKQGPRVAPESLQHSGQVDFFLLRSRFVDPTFAVAETESSARHVRASAIPSFLRTGRKTANRITGVKGSDASLRMSRDWQRSFISQRSLRQIVVGLVACSRFTC